MNWKFWQRILRIDDGKIKFPLAGRMFDGLDSVRDVKLTTEQQEIEALRAKVAEYAGKIEKLEYHHDITIQMWSRHARILLGLECPNPNCRADLVAWREQLHEEHHCPVEINVDALMREMEEQR